MDVAPPVVGGLQGGRAEGDFGRRARTVPALCRTAPLAPLGPKLVQKGQEATCGAGIPFCSHTPPASAAALHQVGYYLPIVAFQFVNMASGTAQIAEARLLENVATGRLSDVLAAQGMGPIIPGTFVHITSDVDPMRDVSVTLSPPDVNEPTTVRFTATVPHGLPTGGKVEVILPSDFSITASDLVVEVVNHTSLYAYRQAYSAPQVCVCGFRTETLE